MPRPSHRMLRNLRAVDETPWRVLDAASTAPQQHFIWSRACADVFSAPDRLHAVAVTDGDAVTAVAPLVRTSGAVGWLESLGFDELAEPTDFAYADGRSLQALARALAHQSLPIRLPRVPSESPTIAALQEAFHGLGWVRVAAGQPYPYIELGPGGGDPELRFNPGRRSDMRRAQRRAEKLGPLSYEVVLPELGSLQRLLDEVYAVEAKSWKGVAGTALALDVERRRFFDRYAVAAAAQGILRLAFLRIGGRTAAAQLALESHDRFWLLKIGYDEAVAHCSPGNLLMLYTLKYAYRQGLRSYEFLGAPAPWTAMWTTTVRSCVTLRAYPASIASSARFVADAGRWAMKRLEVRSSRGAP